MNEHSIPVWYSDTAASSISGLTSLGAKEAVLAWDVTERSISLTAGEHTVFSVPVSEVTRAYFSRGHYFIRINGVRHDLRVRSEKVGSVATDATSLVDSGISAAAIDSNSSAESLQAFLKANGVTMYVTPVRSKAYVIGMVTLLIVTSIVFGVLVYLFSGR